MDKDSLLWEVIEMLKESLEDYEDMEVYTSDIGYTLLETINMNGTVEFSRKATFDKFLAYSDEYSSGWCMLDSNWGSVDFNPFEEPEKVDVAIYTETASTILNMLPSLSDLDAEEIILDRDMIDKLKKELGEFEFDYVWQIN